MKTGRDGRSQIRWGLRLLCLTLAGLTVHSSALAQRAQRDAHPRWRGDISRFHEHDWNLWRAGQWHHGRHDGRLGWWWVVGASWYFYPAPVYPYPSPWEPPPVVLVSPPPGSPPPAPPTPYWYYCEASKGYYPYVPTCPGGWVPVPAAQGNAASPQPK